MVALYSSFLCHGVLVHTLSLPDQCPFKTFMSYGDVSITGHAGEKGAPFVHLLDSSPG